MIKVLKKWWPYLAVIGAWLLIAIVLCSCDRGLKKEIEQLREELVRQQQHVPLERDTIRDSVKMITQKIVEVEKVKEVLTSEDRELIKDMGTKISALESYQKMSMEAMAEVTLASRSDVAADETSVEKNAEDKGSSQHQDSILSYNDAWMDLKYNSLNQQIVVRFRDSLAIAVEKEYKKKFLWWRWGTKGYEVKAVSFNPYTTIRYNSYVKRKR